MSLQMVFKAMNLHSCFFFVFFFVKTSNDLNPKVHGKLKSGCFFFPQVSTFNNYGPNDCVCESGHL